MPQRPGGDSALGLCFLLFAVAQAGLARQAGAWGWPLAWLGLAYLLGAPALLGKRANGAFTLGALPALPYLALTHLAWRIRALGRESAWDEVAPRLFLGRRLGSASELPPGVGLVVDLTCELVEPASVRTAGTYCCLPTLDGCAPEPTAFAALVAEAAAFPGAVYIHCAVGHGRSAALAAAVLLARGLASTPEEAEAQLKRARPGVGLKRAQRALLASLPALRRTAS